MKLVTGGILLLAAEQAFAHAHLIEFPNRDVASGYLIPASLILLVLGVLFLGWGILSETMTKSHVSTPEK